jgi:hypothetical protein
MIELPTPRKADALARKGDREAASWLAEVRAETNELIAWAEAAYAKTRPLRNERDERRDEARHDRELEQRNPSASGVLPSAARCAGKSALRAGSR